MTFGHEGLAFGKKSWGWRKKMPAAFAATTLTAGKSLDNFEIGSQGVELPEAEVSSCRIFTVWKLRGKQEEDVETVEYYQPLVFSMFTEPSSVAFGNIEESQYLENAINLWDTSSLFATSGFSEHEAMVWRGVFSPPRKKKVIFSVRVELETGKLPRWKPRISVDLERLVRREND